MESKTAWGDGVSLTELPIPPGLSWSLAGRGILVHDSRIQGLAVAVLAASVFHSPPSISQAGEELGFPVLQTNKCMEVFTQ